MRNRDAKKRRPANGAATEEEGYKPSHKPPEECIRTRHRSRRLNCIDGDSDALKLTPETVPPLQSDKFSLAEEPNRAGNHCHKCSRNYHAT